MAAPADEDEPASVVEASRELRGAEGLLRLEAGDHLVPGVLREAELSTLEDEPDPVAVLLEVGDHRAAPLDRRVDVEALERS